MRSRAADIISPACSSCGIHSLFWEFSHSERWDSSVASHSWFCDSSVDAGVAEGVGVNVVVDVGVNVGVGVGVVRGPSEMILESSPGVVSEMWSTAFLVVDSSGVESFELPSD